MGIGDEIMASGEVRRLVELRKNDALRVAIWSARFNRQRWDDIWRLNSNIAELGGDHDAKIYSGSGERPYIQMKTAPCWIWKEYRPHPGRIVLTSDEQSFAKLTSGAVVIQPALKPSASPNKQWSLTRWNALVLALLERRIECVQVGVGPEPRVVGARFVQTMTFRQACGALSGARAAVLQEGGLHHAAAALDVPAVVIFGGYISPRCTGYASQRNLFVETEEHRLGCGARNFCPHCYEAMQQITVRRVLKELEVIL